MCLAQQPGDQARRQGRPARPEANDTANVRSISAQSISAASLTSGCCMLSRLVQPWAEQLTGVAAVKAWDPWIAPAEFARKQVLAKPYLANPTAYQSKEPRTRINGLPDCSGRDAYLLTQNKNAISALALKRQLGCPTKRHGS